MINAHAVTKDFEAALCEYTGAKYAVAVNSCTAALHLAMLWQRQFAAYKFTVSIPKKTYCSVPMQAIHAGFNVEFDERKWIGGYEIAPLNVWDFARRFTSDMYQKGEFQCVSFHAAKILADTQGGAILHDNARADEWFRRARFDGRTEGVAPKDDTFILGYHCYMSPDVATRLLWNMSVLPKHNDDLPNDDYPDLSKQECFKNGQA